MANFDDIFEGKSPEEIAKIIAAGQQKQVDLKTLAITNLKQNVLNLVENEKLEISDLLEIFKDDFEAAYPATTANASEEPKKPRRSALEKEAEEKWVVVKLGQTTLLTKAGTAGGINKELQKVLTAEKITVTGRKELLENYLVDSTVYTGDDYIAKKAELAES